MVEHVALGIDIGGTNTAFGLVNRQGDILFESSIQTKEFTTPTDLVDEIYRQVKNTPYFHLIFGIGIGAPNGNLFTGNIEFAPNLSWKGVIPICELFEERFHSPAMLSNDANAAAVGEHLFGCARDLTDFVTITLGTGLGSGVFVEGKLIVGHNGLAGEYGHIRVVPGGRQCNCGRKGCLETYVSSTGIVRSVMELDSENKSQSSLFMHETLSAKAVFEEASKGDLFALEVVDYTAEVLGSALADFSAFSNPSCFVLFGGIAQSGDGFAKKVKLSMEKNILKIYQNRVEIRISHLHNKNAAVLGTAAALFWNSIVKQP